MKDMLWAEPREVSVEDCYFYHTMDIPGHGTVKGEWDLRGRESEYLGGVSYRGKRVLEVGTASGHLCFTMEGMGADVVAFDISENQEWDLVPYAGMDHAKQIQQRKEHIRRMNNGFWFAHRALGSRARAMYGTVYDIPQEAGQFDVCTMGSILLHLRDPFRALECVTTDVRDMVVVTDVVPAYSGYLPDIGGRLIEFLPDANTNSPIDTWFRLSPVIIGEFLRILGFPHTRCSFHNQLYAGRETQMYTVVGCREELQMTESINHDDGNRVSLDIDEARLILEEATLKDIPFSRMLKHLLRRLVRR